MHAAWLTLSELSVRLTLVNTLPISPFLSISIFFTQAKFRYSIQDNAPLNHIRKFFTFARINLTKCFWVHGYTPDL